VFVRDESASYGADCREAMRELMGEVLLQKDEGDSDSRGRAPEPIFVVPVDAEQPDGVATDWDSEADRAPFEEGMLVTGMEPPLPPGEQAPSTARKRRVPESLTERLAHALDQALRHAGLASLTDGASGGSGPVAVVVPILVFDPGDRALNITSSPALAAFQHTLDALDAAAQDLTRGVIGAGVNLKDSQLRVLPWIYADGGLSSLPRVFFEGHPSYKEELLPIIYTPFNEGGFSRDWNVYGRRRLVVDSMALRALSFSRNEFDGVFNLQQGGLSTSSGDFSRRDFVVMHSALFEFPFRSLVREEVLRHVAADPVNGLRLVPALNDLNDLVGDCRESVQGDVKDRCDEIHRIVTDDSLEKDHLDVLPGDRKCQIEDIKPDRERKLAIDQPRGAATVHKNVTKYFGKVVERELQRELKKAVEGATKRFKDLTAKAENTMQRAFSVDLGWDYDEKRSPYSRSSEACGRVLALSNGMQDKLQELSGELEGRKIAKPEQILEKLPGMRASWLESEERLIQEAAKLPTQYSTWLQSVVWGLGVFIVFSSSYWLLGNTTWLLLLALVLGVGVGWGFHWWDRKCHEAHDREWEDLIEQMRNELNTKIARPLVEFLNFRLEKVKFASAEELKLALQASRNRFRTELAGLSRLVSDELDDRLRQRVQRERENDIIDPEAVARFLVELPVNKLDISIDQHDFHLALMSLLGAGGAGGGARGLDGGVLSLASNPSHLRVSAHRDFIRSVVDRALQAAEQTIDQTLQQDARELLAHSVRVGSEPSQLSKLGDYTFDPANKFFIAGSQLSDRLDCNRMLESVGWRDNWIGRSREFHRGSDAGLSLPFEWGVTVVVRRARLDEHAARMLDRQRASSSNASPPRNRGAE